MCPKREKKEELMYCQNYNSFYCACEYTNGPSQCRHFKRYAEHTILLSNLQNSQRRAEGWERSKYKTRACAKASPFSPRLKMNKNHALSVQCMKSLSGPTVGCGRRRLARRRARLRGESHRHRSHTVRRCPYR